VLDRDDWASPRHPSSHMRSVASRSTDFIFLLHLNTMIASITVSPPTISAWCARLMMVDLVGHSTVTWREAGRCQTLTEMPRVTLPKAS
jgi:hypothetical protein